MAIFRIEKTQDYTIMSNHHLRNKSLSLKAKGLLSQMLSLPEDWDYTLKGLSLINRESVDAIRTGIQELEKEGYIVRQQKRDEKGSFAGNEYVIYEHPQNKPDTSEKVPEISQNKPSKKSPDNAPVQNKPPVLENPTTAAIPSSENPLLENPITGNPITDSPLSEKPTQLNIDILNTKLINKDQSINPSINQSAIARACSVDNLIEPVDRSNWIVDNPCRHGDNLNSVEQYRKVIKHNISYDALIKLCNKERLDELFEIMLETVCSQRKYISVAGDNFPAELVKSRLLKINMMHIEYVMDCMEHNTTKIYNIKSYLLTALYNSPATIGNYYSSEVNYDFYNKT